MDIDTVRVTGVVCVGLAVLVGLVWFKCSEGSWSKRFVGWITGILATVGALGLFIGTLAGRR